MRRSFLLAFGLIVLAGFTVLPTVELPKQAVAQADRPVSTELLEQRLEAARQVFDFNFKRLGAGGLAADERVLLWSERWLNAQLALSKTPADRTVAFEAHVKRLKQVESVYAAYAKAGQARESDAQAATYFRADAEIRLLEAGNK